MVQIRTDISVERLRAAFANLGVSMLASEMLSILGSTAVRLHIDDGRTPAEVIRALAAVQMVAVAQPQYVYNLDQASGAPAPSSSRSDPVSPATRRNTSCRSSASATCTAWSEAPTSRSR